MEAFARNLGYSLAELVGTEMKTARASAPAKYRHPENPARSWSGRGRKPQWFMNALEACITAEYMAIAREPRQPFPLPCFAKAANQSPSSVRLSPISIDCRTRAVICAEPTRGAESGRLLHLPGRTAIRTSRLSLHERARLGSRLIDD